MRNFRAFAFTQMDTDTTKGHGHGHGHEHGYRQGHGHEHEQQAWAWASTSELRKSMYCHDIVITYVRVIATLKISRNSAKFKNTF